MESLYEAANRCLQTCEIEEKLRLTQQTATAWRKGLFSLESANNPEPIDEPGRPARPGLVTPGNVPKRRLGTKSGLVALIHAVIHIEFNAINLAWDAVYRFRYLPEKFYSDWIHVAEEEAYHFQLLRKRLNAFGHDYGDLPAHNGLWEMAKKTAFDPMVRMALVPRVLEARGLDVTPGIIKRLHSTGEVETVAILEIILRDEIGHVKIGSHWFKYFCDKRGLSSDETFRELLKQYYTGQLSGPFHYEARQQAGFTAIELKALENMEISKS
ncbi:MAG: ferritin-like domain-containing protein [Burkholderiales bacterium]|nr:ferritin-like domain-containing protein [Nitrosomonas sp.]MCP5275840.1 ferritin-like domain-containing protein [Burkholderiales bacterium]